MEFNWEETELEIKNMYTRLVYSDEEDFYDSPIEPLHFIKKIGNDSYFLRYNTCTKKFTRYIIQNFNQRVKHLEKINPDVLK